MTRQTGKYAPKRASYLIRTRTIQKQTIRSFSIIAACILLGLSAHVVALNVFASQETEAGSRTANAQSVSDSTASGTNAVKFSTASGITCNINATTATFTSALSSATAGQTICLASGNYGVWNGVSKAITIANQPSATPIIELDLNGNANGFTLDGLTISSGYTSPASKNVTIKNSTFQGMMIIDSAANMNLVLDHNTHNNINTCAQCYAGRVTVMGTGGSNSVTIKNSMFDGGNADGIRADTVGVVIEGNTFMNLIDQDPFHTDPIQIYGGSNLVIRGNLFIGGGGGPNGNVAAGIMEADGTSNNLIEYNVFTPGNHGEAMTWYHDNGSIIQHNTLINDTIGLGSKSACGGCTTTIRNNILGGIGNGGGGNNVGYTSSYNLFTSGSAIGTGSITGTPSYVGPVNTWAGYLLSNGSAGKNAASDGKDMGINSY